MILRFATLTSSTCHLLVMSLTTRVACGDSLIAINGGIGNSQTAQKGVIALLGARMAMLVFLGLTLEKLVLPEHRPQ